MPLPLLSNDASSAFAATADATFVSVTAGFSGHDGPASITLYNSGPATVYLLVGNAYNNLPSAPPYSIDPSADNRPFAVPLVSGKQTTVRISEPAWTGDENAYGLWVQGDPSASDVTLTQSDTGTRTGKAWVIFMVVHI